MLRNRADARQLASLNTRKVILNFHGNRQTDANFLTTVLEKRGYEAQAQLAKGAETYPFDTQSCCVYTVAGLVDFGLQFVKGGGQIMNLHVYTIMRES